MKSSNASWAPEGLGPMPLWLRAVLSALCTLALLALVLVLSACSTAPAPLDIQARCIPMRIYSAEWQKKLADALPKIPPIAQEALIDYSKMRQADTACLLAGAHKP